MQILGFKFQVSSFRPQAGGDFKISFSSYDFAFETSKFNIEVGTSFSNSFLFRIPNLRTTQRFWLNGYTEFRNSKEQGLYIIEI